MRLTNRLLEAIQEALIFRTCGEMGSDALPERDYEDALGWVQAQLDKRRAKAEGR